MSTTTLLPVLHDPATRKHLPLAAGDQLPGSMIQLDPAPGNALSSSAAGLFVAPTAVVTDDQVLQGSNLGTVAVTMTPAPDLVDPTQTNYTVEASVNVAAAQAAGPNQIKVIGAGGPSPSLYVAPELTTTGTINAPTLTTGPELPTDIYGDRAALMGNPTGWARLANGQVIPTYTESGTAGAPTAPAVAKQVEFGFWATADNIVANKTLVVTFGTAFPTVPFITVTPDYTPTAGTPVYGDVAIKDLSTTGFTIVRGMNASNDFLPNVHWKAEEK